MKKCLLHKCDAHCCYNIAFEHGELERFHSMIVNPVLGFTPFGTVKITMTDWNLDKNKCPFLRADRRCNIYENRPDVCKKFGEIPELPCEYLKETSRRLSKTKLEEVTVGNHLWTYPEVKEYCRSRSVSSLDRVVQDSEI